MLKLGVHVSIAGKIYNAIERAKNLECNTMQIFARNPRQWRKTQLSDEDVQIFKEKIRQEKISPVVVHIPYTLNLAATKQHFYNITIREFITDLIEANRLGVQYLVTHMGSYKGSTEEKGLEKIQKALQAILKGTEGVTTKILLENTSGSGRWLGSTFSHHRMMLEAVDNSPRIGLCLDTAHVWAAGYKIDNSQGVESLVREIEKEVGIKRLKVIHLNDTKEKLGSHHDRHCAIGEGNIGKKGFSCLINHQKLRTIPFILETPKKTDGDDLRNLTIIKKLYKN